MAALNDFELYALIQDDQQPEAIRSVANKEFTNRQLTPEQVEQIISAHDKTFVAAEQEGLSWPLRWMLVLMPFFIIIHALIAGRYLAKNEKKKWKQYWQSILAGLLLWTVIVIFLARMDFVTKDN